MKRDKYIVAMILFSLMCLNGNGQCLEKNFAFKNGERLHYTGYYNWGFLWVAAGDVTLSVGTEIFEGKPAYKIQGDGKSLKAFDWFFRLRDTLTSYVDTITLAPFYFDRRTHEGKYNAHHRYQFDYTDNKIYSRIQKRSRPEKQDTLQIVPCTFDILTVAYYVRNLDFSKYKKGDKIPLTMLVDNEIHSLYVRYHGLDDVKTRTGEVFECLKFSPLLVEGTMFKKGEDMTVWLSNDENRIPVMVEAKILVGSVKGMLSSYEGLRSVKNSFFKRKKGEVELNH